MKQNYEIIKEGKDNVMSLNYEKVTIVPSIEDSSLCMSDVIGKLAEEPEVNRIIFRQRRNYHYGEIQIEILKQIAGLYNYFLKTKKFLLAFEGRPYLIEKRGIIQNLINMVKSDPIGAYVEGVRLLREEKVISRKLLDKIDIDDSSYYISLLMEFVKLLEKTRIVSSLKPFLTGYQIGDRSIYRKIFSAEITPDFVYTRLMNRIPVDGDEIDMYRIDKNTDVTIIQTSSDIKYLYFLSPPEFKISEDKYELLDLAKRVLISHKPRSEEFVDPEKMRATFFNIGKDMLNELAERKGIELSFNELKELTAILVRYTVGFGLLEVLLQDEKIQDITINGPIGQTPIFIVHQDYNECVTNIIPSTEDAESWATKFRLISGRSLDEANPVLDTELIIPGARARVAIISKPLNPWGLAYALRRHRDKPWTLPLFIQHRMINPLAAGLMSFLIDGSRTMLIAGTRSSGKTSFLSSCLVEIMRKYRIITTEDSVIGDCEVLIKKNGKYERTCIGKLIDDLIDKQGCWYNLSGHEILGNLENIEIFAMDKKGKIKLSKISKFIRHKVSKPVYKVITRTGREIQVTGDHSLFGLGESAKIAGIKVKDLKEMDYIAVPRKINVFNKDVEKFNVLDDLRDLKEGFLCGDAIKKFIRTYRGELAAIGKEHGYPYNSVKSWISRGVVPTNVMDDIFSLGFYLKPTEDIFYKVRSSSKKIPVEIHLDEDILTLIGIWIADGCYDKSSILFSVPEKELRQVVYNIAESYGLKVTLHSDKVTLILHSKAFKNLMKGVFGLKGDAYTKRIPNWVFNLSERQVSYILKGIFSGDGCCAKEEIVIPLASKFLLTDIQTLLLRLGISLRIGTKRKDKTYNASISNLKSWIPFRENIKFLQDYKNEKLNLLCNKISLHDTTDVIPLLINTKEKIKEIYPKFNNHDYITKNNNVGREKLGEILEQVIFKNDLVENLDMLSTSDILWDQVKSIEIIENYEGYVYDVSVPGCESFVCNNIVAHNTLELPVDSLREMGYNIQPMKVRSAITGGETEMEASEGIRTSLRMGDSALVVGEIRSEEAKALFEAMRIGALANVVAGTIHGDSPYGVYDRLVNDLKVPKTSFKATDVIVVCNPVKSSDGLNKWRRVMQITEIRKRWEDDPLRENGFIDLMKYDTREDTLKPSDELMNGDSEVIKGIASNVGEWVGNWDAVWDNIILRAKIKEALVNYSAKTKNNNILEAPFVIQSNDMFHRISDSVKKDIGHLEPRRIFFEWDEWTKKMIKMKRV